MHFVRCFCPDGLQRGFRKHPKFLSHKVDGVIILSKSSSAASRCRWFTATIQRKNCWFTLVASSLSVPLNGHGASTFGPR